MDPAVIRFAQIGLTICAPVFSRKRGHILRALAPRKQTKGKQHTKSAYAALSGKVPERLRKSFISKQERTHTKHKLTPLNCETKIF